ncbi:MAG: prolyl-tRNA synthetase associated domain-containing protein [Oscillospiraceae bacterium]|jgi:Ala-tRNA(Pro) deacylase|nr:prolyl-tRNA synthetase associated domain-containing protein [Oscillospiraceae bacterium]
MGIFVDRQLYIGRPKTNDDLFENEIKTYDLLDRLHIPFERASHESAKTIADCGEIEAVLGGGICKNLFLTDSRKTQFFLLLMPGDKPFKTAVVSKILGTSRLSFGPEEQMTEYLRLLPGSVSVMGLQFDADQKVRLLIDKEVADASVIRCHPCRNTATLNIKTTDLFEKILPAISHDPLILEIPREA